MTTYEELHQRHVADAATMMPQLMARLEWPPERLAAHRLDQLRQLLRIAREQSPWHRKRLLHVNPDEVDEGTLAELPVMTKDDLMENFDEIVTDGRLQLPVVEAHLESLTTDAYLLDRYHACASGGSTGRRGVFVYDWEPWAVCYASWFRYEVRARQRDPQLAGAPARIGAVAAANATHMSSSLLQTFSSPNVESHRFPVTLPLPEVVAGLNAFQPTVLFGYPSALHPLAHEAEAGRLRISPLRVISASEPLLPEIRASVEKAWRAPVINVWGTSETCITAVACGESPWLHVSEDLTIVEPVDTAGRPVPPGVRSDKIYLTNLFNPTLPLIRMEVTDEVTFVTQRCPCGSTLRCIEDLHGRLDDSFDYGGLSVHPHVFRSPLSRRREVVEYQVHQTPRGASVFIRCTGPSDTAGLAAEIAAGLDKLGVTRAEVTVTSVERLERQTSGKLKRFVPLGR